MSVYDLQESPSKIEEDQFPREDSVYRQIRFLLGYAALAPSSHNSQPWRFSAHDKHLNIFFDDDRWLRVADADKRELFTSVGCARKSRKSGRMRFV